MENYPPTGLLRRLASIMYDTLLICGVVFVAALPLPLIPEGAREHLLIQLSTQVYLIGVVLLFFSWFWTHGGQTLGMRAWRLRIERDDGGPVGWSQAVRRFFAAGLSWAPCGLGFLWSLFDPDKLTWHDRLSGTRLVVLPKMRRAD